MTIFMKMFKYNINGLKQSGSTWKINCMTKKICKVNLVRMWAFFKIPDGDQDGRQRHGLPKMDLFLQTLDQFWLSSNVFPDHGLNGNTFRNN